MLILLVPLIYCQEPLNLGRGSTAKAINLDIGAIEPGYKPFMSNMGFSAPQVPQAMALSPGAMIHQAQLFRDQSASMMDETSDILNKTKALADQAQRAADSTEALAEQVRADATESSNYASNAERSLNEIKLIYSDTLAEAERTSNLTRRNEELARETGVHANESASHVEAAQDILNETRSIYNNIALIQDNISLTAQEIHFLNDNDMNLSDQVAINTNTSAYDDFSRK